MFYRTRDPDIWISSHLKTYKNELFRKLEKEDWLNSDGTYFRWAADRFILYGLLELAGP